MSKIHNIERARTSKDVSTPSESDSSVKTSYLFGNGHFESQ